MGEQKLGIKETKEALVGLNELSIFMAKRLKDGVGADDAMAIFQALIGDAEFKAKLSAAAEGIKAVPAEIKDVDLSEAVDLIQLQISYIPKIKDALAK